ncbi:MAG: hypothetical protein NTX91_05015, partial [candidate division SR1 bacterium]|nr:hypothetical protein [candidate division SR1 bacterium]
MVPKTMESQCSSEIIRAHTVSKSSNLKLIARDGYIYSYDLSLFKLDKKHGKLDFDLVPISKASTFYGFCKYHDNEIFKPIED